MPVPTLVTDLTSVASGNFPVGADSVFPELDNYLRAHAAFIKGNYDALSAKASTSALASTATTAEGSGMSGYLESLAYGALTAGGKLNLFRSFISCAGDGATDDATELQSILSSLSSGGVVYGVRGKTYKCSTSLVANAGTVIDLQGSELRFTFASGADVVGLDARGSLTVRNGSVNVVAAGNPTSTEKSMHANIVVGRTGASLAGYARVRVQDLSMTNSRTDSVGGTLVCLQSGSSEILVENITVPSSSGLRCAVNASWAGPGGTPPATSEHPRNITINNITGGTMTKAATTDVSFIDISGAYNADVSNITLDSTTGDAVVQVRPGAFGTAVAPATVAPMVNHGIHIRNVTCKSALNQCIALNGRAHGGGGVPAASYSIPVTIENVKSKGAGGSATAGTAGIRVLFIRDVKIRNCEITEHYYGFYAEEDAKRVTVEDSRFYRNQRDGCVTTHGTTAPEDVTFVRVESYLNGQAGAGYSGFYAEACTRTHYVDCIAGDETSESSGQSYGFRVAASSAADTRFSGRNRVRNFRSGGAKYLFAAAVLGDRQFTGGTDAALSTGSTQFAPLQGVGAPSAAEIDASVLVGADLVLTNFRVKLSAAPNGATKSRNIRVVDDGGATALEVAITNTATTGTDFDAVEVAAGSELSVQSLVTNTPDAARAKWSCEAFLS